MILLNLAKQNLSIGANQSKKQRNKQKQWNQCAKSWCLFITTVYILLVNYDGPRTIVFPIHFLNGMARNE